MKFVLMGKKDMLGNVQDMKAVRGKELGLSDQHVVLCKVRLVGAMIKIGVVQMENLRGLLGVRRIYRGSNPAHMRYRE